MNNQVLWICLIFLFGSFKCVVINNEETLWVPKNQYLEYVKNQIVVLEKGFDPGQIAIQLNFSYVNQSSNNKVEATYDVFRFSNCSVPQYICLVNAMQYQQYGICKDIYTICSDQNCTECIQQKLNPILGYSCCLYCKETVINLVKNQEGDFDSQSQQLSKQEDDTEIIILDNSPFPYDADLNYGDIFIQSQYQVQIIPNNKYYQYTLVLIILLSVILMLLSSCLCILIYKYKKAKQQNLEQNLVSGNQQNLGSYSKNKKSLKEN